MLLQRSALKDVVIRMYWDGEEQPSVDVPLGDLFGASFGRPRRLVSSKLVIAGGGYLCRFPMPYNRGARIELVNDSGRTVRHLFVQVGYYEEPDREQAEATFHAQCRISHAEEGAPPVEVVQATGRGRLVGMSVDIAHRRRWLKPPLRAVAIPRGFGLGLLEGWEAIVVDGDEQGAIVGTGAEDYFLSGFYFKDAPFSTPTHGCTYRNFWSGRVSAYRLHDDDPIAFRESLTFRLDHGLKNAMAGTYHTVAYWYQNEPHAPFPRLPTNAERTIRAATVNPAQWLVLTLLVMLPVLVALGVMLWRR